MIHQIVSSEHEHQHLPDEIVILQRLIIDNILNISSKTAE